jgi:mevalonate kinase
MEELVRQGEGKGWTGKVTGSGMGGCIILLAERKKNLLASHQDKFLCARLDKYGLFIKSVKSVP